MLPGFLPFASDSTFMMDVVALAMFAILPLLTWSIYLVKVKRDYRRHKQVQLGLGILLAVAVALFEIDVRMAGGWKVLARHSPYFGGLLDKELYVHLFFAVSTTVLWCITIPLALKRFPNPPVPSAHSALHKKLGWAAAIFMYGTSITGWTFYLLAFVLR